MAYQCNIYMCSASVGGLALDGITQIPVQISYAIWDDFNDELANQVTNVSLVNYQDVIWNKTTYKQGLDLNDMQATKLGWKYTDKPGNDVIKGLACTEIPPDDGHTYVTKTFYLQHTYAEQADLDNNFGNKNPTFSIAAKVDLSDQSWNTTKTGGVNVSNALNQIVSLTLVDGTPELNLYLYKDVADNGIIANGIMQIPVNIEFQISSLSQGSTGKPLSSQVKAHSKLVESKRGDDLDGYCSGPDPDSYGTWIVGTEGDDTSTYAPPNLSSCTGCGTEPLTNPIVQQTYYISHSESLIKEQTIGISAWVQYTPPGATTPITWSSDFTNGTPSRCCVGLKALSENQKR